MRLYLGGYLGFYHRQAGSWLHVELAAATPLTRILDELNIPAAEVHLVVVNGELIALDAAIVSDQDEVKIFSAVGGG